MKSTLRPSEPGSSLLLLGLCPLLAVTDTPVKALSIGLATLMVLVLSSLAVFGLRAQVNNLTRLPALIIIIASVTMLIDLLLQVYAYPVYKSLGLFVPLIAANPLVLACLIARFGVSSADFADSGGIPMGRHPHGIACWFILLLVSVGALREILATGAILADLHLISSVPVEWKLVLIEDYRKFLFMLAAPGAFISLGFIVALRNLLLPAQAKEMSTPGQTKRVRIHL